MSTKWKTWQWYETSPNSLTELLLFLWQLLFISVFFFFFFGLLVDLYPYAKILFFNKNVNNVNMISYCTDLNTILSLSCDFLFHLYHLYLWILYLLIQSLILREISYFPKVKILEKVFQYISSKDYSICPVGSKD